jgi:predicted porin
LKTTNKIIPLVLSALAAGSAAAQSPPQTVTLYGRVDVNITYYNKDVFYSRSTTSPDYVKGAQLTQAATSRWGLRGVEDLGGGLRAIYQLESRINPDTGTTDGGNRLFGREAWLGLQGGFGTLRFGRTLMPTQRIISNYDPHGTDGIGSYGSTDLALGHGVLVRADNGIYYETPNLGGFTSFIAYALDENPAQSSDVANIRLRFQMAGADFSVGYADAGLPGNKVTSIGGSYDLKFAKPMFSYHDGKRANNEWSSYVVGLTAPLGTGELRAAYSAVEQNTGGSVENTKFAVGYDYPLSRRTAAYGTFSRDTSQTAAGVKRPTANGVEIGFRHNF